MPTLLKIKEHPHVACYHCGEDCKDTPISSAEKVFCCQGCKLVYEIINQNGLCDYYTLASNPGISQKIKVREGKFAFLDNTEIASKLIHFNDGGQAHITFYLPQMHCSSCIWLLEHLQKLDQGVVSSTVNFLKREVTIVFKTGKTSLRPLAELLTSIGYEPHISLQDMKGKAKTYDRSRIYKIGIAGFCFANIMMMSFPEYFASGDIGEAGLKAAFSYINLGLSLPVFFYCASEFFVSAYKSLKQKFLNIDAPIALAILITFVRSVYEIATQSGAGYLDSMSGIVFFMLLGRFFQNKTYETLSFDRDYRSYFPIGVTRIIAEGQEEQIPVAGIQKGDRLRIHSHEIIPADGILFMGKGTIDYSFVTGESMPSEKGIGELVYAGGKQVGASIEVEVVKEVSQSYLTQLWNNAVFKKQAAEKKASFVHRVSRYFTYVLFSIAIATAVYWNIHDPARTWSAVTAILIVACPCALLLSATFTNGNLLSRLQKAGFYVKHAGVLESISEADTLVFDKTGTISMQARSDVSFEGGALTAYGQQLVRSLAIQSNHPLSKAIVAALPVQPLLPVKDFKEEKGRGSEAVIDGEQLKLGSGEFVAGARPRQHSNASHVYVSINGELAGYFAIKAVYRDGLVGLIHFLKKRYRLAVISGDNNAEQRVLEKIFGAGTQLLFEQSPQSKLDFVKCLQQQKRKVIMIGDGLNDAGALQQSDAGIVISDDINNFSPGCDAILDGKQFAYLNRLLEYCRKEKQIIYGSFMISILYNIIGLSYAVQGHLSPVIAAILMPVSSVSIVLYTTLMSAWLARKLPRH